MTDKVGQGSENPAEGSENQKQSSANAETEMPQWAKDLNSKVDEALGQARAAQSGKDQLQAQLNEAQSTFESAFDYAKKFEDPAEAERAWFIDQQIAQSRANQKQGQELSQQNDQSLAGQSSDAGTVDPELLKSLGVDPQSPEYLAQVQQGKVGYEAALNVLAAQQTQNVEGAATGASGGAGGASASTTTQQQVLRDQYNAELDEAAKLTYGVLKPQALFQIQTKYAELGLQDLQ
jgi:hypothetical protein